MNIYCFVNGEWEGDVFAVAVCGRCGAIIGSHMSSNPDFAKRAMLHAWKHAAYANHAEQEHGDGVWNLVWVDNPAEHAELQRLNKVAESEASDGN